MSKTIDEVANETGEVLEINGKKVAVYKDEGGKTLTISPICTHRHCIVKWNGNEKTWDCPCHGARYTKEGKVIKGPAKKDLAKVEI